MIKISNTIKINILAWVMIVIGVVGPFFGEEDSSWWKVLLGVVVWWSGGVGLLLRNETIRKIVSFACLAGIFFPLLGLVTLITIAAGKKKLFAVVTLQNFALLFVVVIICFLYFVMYKFFQSKEVKSEFSKQKSV